MMIFPSRIGSGAISTMMKYRSGKERIMPSTDRIVVDPAILVGKPCVKGTRLSVEFLLGLLSQGWGEVELLRNYPGLTREDILACLAYACDVIGQEKVYPYKVA
jgi:uncharacterized protein (DUF433 family)